MLIFSIIILIFQNKYLYLRISKTSSLEVWASKSRK